MSADKTEFALHKHHGYSAAPRRPLLELGKRQGGEFLAKLEDLLNLESELNSAR